MIDLGDMIAVGILVFIIAAMFAITKGMKQAPDIPKQDKEEKESSNS